MGEGRKYSKDSKTETSIERGLQNIRKSRIWMQQLNKARAKQRDLTELLIAAGRSSNPDLRKDSRVTALGEGSGRGWQPSLHELKHQDTACGHCTETCSHLGGEKQSPSPRLPAGASSKFHFLYNFKDLSEALLAFKEWALVCSFSNFLYSFLNHFFGNLFSPLQNCSTTCLVWCGSQFS